MDDKEFCKIRWLAKNNLDGRTLEHAFLQTDKEFKKSEIEKIQKISKNFDPEQYNFTLHKFKFLAFLQKMTKAGNIRVEDGVIYEVKQE